MSKVFHLLGRAARHLTAMRPYRARVVVGEHDAYAACTCGWRGIPHCSANSAADDVVMHRRQHASASPMRTSAAARVQPLL